jgi:cell division GTPase FtsZ
MEIAKEHNIYAAAVVCTPFTFEGAHRKQEAVDAVKSISEKADIMTVISGDSVIQNADNRIGVDSAFQLLDEKMAQAVRDTLGFISSRLLPGK